MLIPNQIEKNPLFTPKPLKGFKPIPKKNRIEGESWLRLKNINGIMYIEQFNFFNKKINEFKL